MGLETRCEENKSRHCISRIRKDHRHYTTNQPAYTSKLYVPDPITDQYTKSVHRRVHIHAPTHAPL
ncbi:hypothetical protein E2C01_017629 [Portunus trituberculatus]|uniref:Uncharacterized protein n=1 Tax=Portunus trituberculatus TaxID=210409 RepID=A0A5B7DUC4_PORTR|nr:hypothetical protein [Portunus trituberculatus]